MQGGKNRCACPHHKVFPILIILLGLTFLLQAMGWLTNSTAMMVWPVIVIAAGVMKLADKSGMCKCC